MTENNSTNDVCNCVHDGSVGVKRFACEYGRCCENFWVDYSKKNEEDFFFNGKDNKGSDYF